jgi:hypothetical protein
MRQWLRSHLTYANVMVTVLGFIVLTGGTAVALGGSNTVFTDDIANDTQPASGGNPAGGLAAGDLRPNSVGTSEILNGQVSVLDTNKVIPSGATVTGAFNASEDADITQNAVVVVSPDFNGLRAPTALTDADVSFDDAGASAAAAVDSEESSACTGSIGNPTAPPGKVCIYLFQEGVFNGTAFGDRMGGAAPGTQADDKGFRVRGHAANSAGFGGTWAYRAP